MEPEQQAVQNITAFFDHFQIPYKIEELPDDTFLPGVTISGGAVVYDPTKLKYPGDLLHEAGHLAVTLPEERDQIFGDIAVEFPHKKDDEMAVMCWSFLASQVCKIPVQMLFHDGGYKGESQYLQQMYSSGQLMGLPLLEWMGIARREQDGRISVLSWMRPAVSEESANN